MAGALTLVELLVAMVVMTLVLGALSGVMYSTVRATSDVKQTRSHAVRSTLVQARLAADLHDGLAFLDARSDRLALWAGDDNDDDGVNLDEILLVERDPTTRELLEFRIVWPATMSEAQIEAANTAYAGTSNFNTVADTLKQHPACRSTPLASALNLMTPMLNRSLAPDASLVTLELEFDVNGESQTRVTTGGPRFPRRPQ